MNAGAAFAAVTADRFGLPRPGSGHTGERFAALARACTDDIATGRLIEAHADADAILGEIGGASVGPGEFWGVWAADPPNTQVNALGSDDEWELSGTKPWCSGAQHCTHALITAHTESGERLFAIERDQKALRVDPAVWKTDGMRGSDTCTVILDRARAHPVGPPGAYLERPGFWHGAIGVAACWFGGARKVATPLYRAAVRRDDPLLRMHLGAVDAVLAAGWAQLLDAGRIIDADPQESTRRLAHQVRWSIEQVAATVLDRTGRALGPGPLTADAGHAQAVADLMVYVRQSHADRDLVVLGSLAGAAIPGPTATTPDTVLPATRNGQAR
ncbi:acyl-CoA dehydrogenase family protein [Gordonia sp. NPDC003585]|uniref:acyl-CoA dehydrogenase family protein n=1 Tax=Gordonia sp. NPDC003585 TaxID=3154275 RepID=UPI0033B7AB1F